MPSRTINPIIPGFAPDPSVVRVNGTFYLVNSSFHMFPGLPIYTSKDLVNWEHIGNAINRQSQLSLNRSETIVVPPGPGGSVVVAAGGLYAPTIRHHDGMFYIVCTNIIHRAGEVEEFRSNFILSCQDPHADSWSDPIPYQFNGIDPSLFWDDDGRSYLHGAAAPGPMTKIHLFEIDLQTGAKLSEERKIWDGTGGTWPEGPHLYKRDGWYYLLISEGGCWEDHMITAARSRSIWGPYEPFSKNPILTARGDRESIRHTGHSDVFEDDEGRVWAVCLAVRKDEGCRYNMGRETFLTTGSWPAGEWPRLDRVKDNPRGLPVESKRTLKTRPIKDFLYIRDAELGKHQISDEGRRIVLVPGSTDMSHKNDSPVFVGKRQRELDGRSSVRMLLGSEPREGTTKAGLACYKDEHRFLRIFYDASEKLVVLELVNTAHEFHSMFKYAAAPGKSLGFRIEYTGTEYAFSYSVDGDGTDDWKLAGTLDTKEFTDQDFTGPVIGVFAFSEGEASRIEFSDLVIE